MNHAYKLLTGMFAVACASAVMAADPPAAVGNKADATKVVPARSDLQPGAAPTVQSMGENAQRQHDRNSAAPKASDAATTTGTATAGTAPAGAGQVRDWAAIDTNKDNLISPEEMEEFLKQGSATPAPKS